METTNAKQYIYSKLIADSQILTLVGQRIFDSYVPESVSTTQFPAIVYQLYSPGDDLSNVGGIRVWADLSYIIKAIDKSSDSTIASSIADRIDQLLHRTSNVQYKIQTCLRVRPIEYRETLPQVEYVHVGGIYNFKVSN